LEEKEDDDHDHNRSDNDISSLDGIHCGEDSGLGSVWEANLRMPALIRWDGKIKPGSITNATVSTLDVVPTLLSILDETIRHNSNNNNHKFIKNKNNIDQGNDHMNCKIEKTGVGDNSDQYQLDGNDALFHNLQFDGIDISHVLFQPIHDNNHHNQKISDNVTTHNNDTEINRFLFFWRDGFDDGPLGPPYGRYDVVAVKVIQEQYHYHNDNIMVSGGPYHHYKLWFYTKSSHLNDDQHIYHDPPLIFQIDQDPAEEFPIEIHPNDGPLQQLIDNVKIAIDEHKKSITWTYPLTVARDSRNIPCVNHKSGCRTSFSITTTTTSVAMTSATDKTASSIL
jgi:C-terminal region of aryl-sulfatase